MTNEPKAGDGLDAEILAAYIDQRLPPDERAAVEAKLATDPDSYELLVELIHANEALKDQLPQDEEQHEPEERPNERQDPKAGVVPLVPRAPKMKRWAIVGGVLAVAAALVLVVRVQPELLQRLRGGDAVDPQLAKLVEAVGEERYIEARLTGGFKYGPLRQVTRGQGDLSRQNLALLAAAGELQKKAQEQPSDINLHQWALAQMSVGDTAAAIRTLSSLRTSDRESAEVASDLAAAYLARWRTEGDATDLVNAAEAAARALEKDPRLPEALFNHGLSLESMGLFDAAAEAWRAYIAVDPDSGWSQEARRRLASGQPQARSEAPDPRPGQLSLADSRAALEQELLQVWPRTVGSGADKTAQLVHLRSVASRAAILALAQHDDTLSRQIQEVVAVVEDGRHGDVTLAAEALACLGEVSDAAKAGAFDRLRSQSAKCAERWPIGLPMSRVVLQLAQSTAAYLSGDLDEAVELAKAVRAVAPGPIVTGRAEFMLGGLSFTRGQYETASVHLRRAVSLLEQAGEARMAASAHDVLASAGSALGLPGDAWLSHVKAVTLTHGYQATGDAFAIRSSFAFALLRHEFPRTALTVLEQNLNGARQSNSPRRLAEILYNIARAHLALGRRSEALAALDEAKRTTALVDDQTVRERIEAETLMVEAELHVADSPALALETTRRAQRLFSSQGSYMRLAALMEYEARAGLQAGLSATELSPVVAGGVALIERQEALIEQRRARTSFRDAVWGIYEHGITLHLRDGRPWDALALADRAQIRQHLGFDRVAPASLRELQAALPEEHVVVVYSVAAGGLRRWVVTRDVFDFTELPVLRADLDQLVAGARAEFQFGSESGPAVNQAKLSALLFEAMPQAVWTQRRWVLVPDGVLSRLPFGAFARQDRGTPLIEQHEIVLASSVSSVLAALRRQRPVAGEPALSLIGNPANTATPLPGARREIEELAGAYQSVERIEGRQATVDAFLRALRQPGIVHFSGHGVVDDSSPWLGRLVLAGSEAFPSGLLYAELLERQRARASVVVLAACSTADGTPMKGSGLTSLAAAFTNAGVPFVVATLWDVPDDDARRVFALFHRQLLDLKDPVSAVTAAQRSASAQGVSPAAWAALTILLG